MTTNLRNDIIFYGGSLVIFVLIAFLISATWLTPILWTLILAGVDAVLGHKIKNYILSLFKLQ